MKEERPIKENMNENYLIYHHANLSHNANSVEFGWVFCEDKLFCMHCFCVAQVGTSIYSFKANIMSIKFIYYTQRVQLKIFIHSDLNDMMWTAKALFNIKIIVRLLMIIKSFLGIKPHIYIFNRRHGNLIL